MTRNTEKLKKNLKIRAALLRAVRDFFCSRGYLETETPLRCPDLIPEGHIDPFLSEKSFLQASPEMCMKRLLSMGFHRIFQVARSFRKGERSIRHLPEFTLLEWYRTQSSYFDLMDECRQLLSHIAAMLGKSTTIHYQGRPIQLDAPWPKISVAEAFLRYTDTSAGTAIETGTFDEILSFQIEPELGNFNAPVILYDYPASQGALAALNPDDPETAQRFEFYIAGLEIANGFTELTSPPEQRHRFEAENHIRQKRGASRLPMPEKFLGDLEKMPDAAGIALGIDRLAMIFCDTPDIADVTALLPEML